MLSNGGICSISLNLTRETVKSTSSQSSIEYMYPKIFENVRRDQAAKVARGGWTRSCDRLRDYGVVCTNIVWPSFEKVLLSIHKKRILLESACEAHSGKRVNPVQFLGSCGATVFELSSCRQGYVDSIGKQQDPSRSVPTILHLSTGYCSCIMSYAYRF